MTLQLDPMSPSDWPTVREIYLEGIATRQATFETEAPKWEAWDASHSSFARLVARQGETVVGWAALSPVSSRRHMQALPKSASMSRRAREAPVSDDNCSKH